MRYLPWIANMVPARFGRVAMVALTLVIGLAPTAQAQKQDSIDKQFDVMNDVAQNGDFGIRNGSVVVAPIPFSNPTIGSGLMLGAAYLFQNDAGSKPSMIGIGGLRSDNGSSGVGLSVNLAFDNNRWLFESIFAAADIRYDLFTSVGNIPIRQDGVLARVSLSYGVTPELSFGAALRYLDTAITANAPGFPPIPPPFDSFLDVEVASFGLVSQWDRRDDTIYATTGSLLEVEAFRNVALGGLIDDYSKIFANYTQYLKIGQSGVLVGRVSGCAASTSTPFFDAFRGFSATQFLDLRSFSAQVEYRQQFSKRIGMVAFGGVGMVGPRYSGLDIGGVHGAVGIGGRYRVSKKFPLDFAVDFTRNTQDENLLYIYVGQRF